MKYFAEFDTNGFKTAGYVADSMPYTEDDIRELFPNAIEISEEDQALYITGEYYRGPDGTPIKIIINDPTKEELKKQALDNLNADYSQRLKKIESYYARPDLLLTGTSNTAKIEIIKNQLISQYQSTHAEMITKQGVILNG